MTFFKYCFSLVSRVAWLFGLAGNVTVDIFDLKIFIFDPEHVGNVINDTAI